MVCISHQLPSHFLDRGLLHTRVFFPRRMAVPGSGRQLISEATGIPRPPCGVAKPPPMLLLAAHCCCSLLFAAADELIKSRKSRQSRRKTDIHHLNPTLPRMPTGHEVWLDLKCLDKAQTKQMIIQIALPGLKAARCTVTACHAHDIDR